MGASMNRREFVTAAVAAGPVLAVEAKTDESAPRSLSIVPSRIVSWDKSDQCAAYSVQGAIHLRSSLRCINVAIRNRSSRLVSVWDEGNSWGFHNLHLEVMGMTENLLGKIERWEKPVIVRRTQMVGWGGNR